MKTKFYFNGTSYKIKFKYLKDLLGETDFSKNKITINPYQSKHEIKKTLLHEILHIMLNGCKGINKKTRDIKANEETVVLHLESGLIMAMQQNKKLFKYLLK